MRTHKKTDYITDIALAAYEELTSLYGNGPAMSAAIVVFQKLPADQREAAVKYAKGELEAFDIDLEPAKESHIRRIVRDELKTLEAGSEADQIKKAFGVLARALQGGGGYHLLSEEETAVLNKLRDSLAAEDQKSEKDKKAQ